MAVDALLGLPARVEVARYGETERIRAQAEALRANSGTQPFDAARARAVSREMESIFLRQLLRAMRATTLEHASAQEPGTRMYRGMFDDALADRIAQTSGLGLADRIYREIERQATSREQNASALARDPSQPVALPGENTPVVRTPDGQPVQTRTAVGLEPSRWIALPQEKTLLPLTSPEGCWRPLGSPMEHAPVDKGP